MKKKGQKQHYVPEVYLKSFSFDEVGNLYCLRIKPYFDKLKIKIRNKSSVCYNPNNYKFNETEGREEKIKADSNYIENNLFKYENEFINSISEKINSKKNITLTEAENLIRVLLSIKNRNLYFKKLFQGSKLMEIQFEKEIQKIRNFTIKYKVENPKKYEAFISLIENKLRKQIEDESETSDLFNDQIVRVEERKDKNQEWLIKEMCKSKFLVFCTDESNPFLTSDNPGFTVHEGDAVGNLFLGSAKAFAFPISKTRLFVIMPDDRDGNELITKRIKYIETPEDFLKLSNKATIINSEERIFSNSKDLLEELMGKFDFEKMEYKKNTRHNTNGSMGY